MASYSLFNSIRAKKPKRNRFNLSHDVKTTAQFGKLIPILCQPVVPGDTFKLNTEILCRFAPFQAPVMHRVKVYTHFFFVPNRLIWSGWREFATGGEDGTSTIQYPRLDFSYGYSKSSLITLFGNGSLADYLGFPSYDDAKQHTGNGYGVVDALPFRAYSLIWNEYYRDQNLQDEIDIQKDVDGIFHNDGKMVPYMQLRKRAWKKDYFTSALPFAQRGDEVELPLQGTADILWEDGRIVSNGPGVTKMVDATGRPIQTLGQTKVDFVGVERETGILHQAGVTDGTDVSSVDAQEGFLVNHNGVSSPLSGITTHFNASDVLSKLKGVDLSTVSSATINEFRRAMAAQQFLEAMARGGSRYTEQLFSIFGVRSSDARLQRPEFLGGGQSNVVISDVLQTSQTTDGNPLGSPAGHGVSVQSTHSFKRFFEEHGFVIGIMSIMPMPAYQQGLPRLFQKFDRLDYYWPQFAHLGEQEITQGELFHTGIEEQDSKLFGYIPRYAEYKYIPDSVHGDFRGNLSFWHMGRIFDSPPALNADFISSVETAANRPFSVQDTSFDKIWINIHHNLKAIRPMPKYGTPRI